MAPKFKSVPSRLGPPAQLSRHLPMVEQKKFEPKMREVLARQVKLIMKWMHTYMTWEKILMSWMVVLIASKMVLLILTFEYFSLTALISLQIFHGVWTIAFFCLNIIDSKIILPNASCLLAGYLPATTVLHILLIPKDYPLKYIIIDAIGTFLAIISMFLLLRMECTEILHEAEELWQRQSAESESGDSVSTTSSTELQRHDYNHHLAGVGPTIITLDSMGFNSLDVPENTMGRLANNVVFDQAIDLEPIDFEHFVDEPGTNRTEEVFKVASKTPFMRGR